MFSFLKIYMGILNTTLCDKVCQWLVTDRWFSPGTPVYSTNKTDCQDITKILLKVMLNTITLNLNIYLNHSINLYCSLIYCHFCVSVWCHFLSWSESEQVCFFLLPFGDQDIKKGRDVIPFNGETPQLLKLLTLSR